MVDKATLMAAAARAAAPKALVVRMVLAAADPVKVPTARVAMVKVRDKVKVKVRVRAKARVKDKVRAASKAVAAAWAAVPWAAAVVRTQCPPASRMAATTISSPVSCAKLP